MDGRVSEAVKGSDHRDRKGKKELFMSIVQSYFKLESKRGLRLRSFPGRIFIKQIRAVYMIFSQLFSR